MNLLGEILFRLAGDLAQRAFFSWHNLISSRTAAYVAVGIAAVALAVAAFVPGADFRLVLGIGALLACCVGISASIKFLEERGMTKSRKRN